MRRGCRGVQEILIMIGAAASGRNHFLSLSEGEREREGSEGGDGRDK